VEIPAMDVPLHKCIDLPVLASFLMHFFTLHIFFFAILPQSDNNCINSSHSLFIGTAFLAVCTIIHFMATRHIEKVIYETSNVIIEDSRTETAHIKWNAKKMVLLERRSKKG
jgi:hypothetical protein